jgi:hypothetical protein
MTRWCWLVTWVALAACHSFDAEPATDEANVEPENVWVDWECDGSTLVIVDASANADASNVEDACVDGAVRSR